MRRHCVWQAGDVSIGVLQDQGRAAFVPKAAFSLGHNPLYRAVVALRFPGEVELRLVDPAGKSVAQRGVPLRRGDWSIARLRHEVSAVLDERAGDWALLGRAGIVSRRGSYQADQADGSIDGHALELRLLDGYWRPHAVLVGDDTSVLQCGVLPGCVLEARWVDGAQRRGQRLRQAKELEERLQQQAVDAVSVPQEAKEEVDVEMQEAKRVVPAEAAPLAAFSGLVTADGAEGVYEGEDENPLFAFPDANTAAKQFYVKTLTGHVFSFPWAGSATIGQVREATTLELRKLQPRARYLPAELRLIFAGKQLGGGDDENRTLSDDGVASSDTIHLVLRSRKATAPSAERDARLVSGHIVLKESSPACLRELRDAASVKRMEEEEAAARKRRRVYTPYEKRHLAFQRGTMLVQLPMLNARPLLDSSFVRRNGKLVNSGGTLYAAPALTGVPEPSVELQPATDGGALAAWAGEDEGSLKARCPWLTLPQQVRYPLGVRLGRRASLFDTASKARGG